MSRYRRCPVRLFPSHLGKSSLSFITLILFVFHAASMLTALVHPGHIVVYATAMLSLTPLAARNPWSRA
ncbi:hypothetical protein CWM52_16760 [Raoultella sp. T31]|nr:hypothetical protein CWM52_16760 [Raoultella sp. T31]